MTFGVYISYRVLDIADLTVEGSLTMGAAIAAVCISVGMNPFLALLLSFLGGMCAGLVTGLLHTALRIPALLSGILTKSGVFGIIAVSANIFRESKAWGNMLLVLALITMLGGAMLAAVGCGAYPDVAACAKALTSVKTVTEPDPALTAAYEEKYNRWRQLYPALKGVRL